MILHNNNVLPRGLFGPKLPRVDPKRLQQGGCQGNKGGNESGRKGSGLLHTPKRQQQPAGSSDRERKGKEKKKKTN